MYQVADADGAFYPLTMGGEPITRFNEGWSPRGLQTGLPPLHVLELEHVSEDSALWLHDETLNYRANAVLGLPPDLQQGFFAHMESIVRTLYAECVLAPQASIPSVAHQFDGMLPRTIQLLIVDTAHRIMPATDVVVLDRLQDIGAGYGSGAGALSPDWIARSIDASASEAQERFDLPYRQCARHLDPANGTVFYVMQNGDPGETSLFVPSHRVVVVRSRHTHDPLLLLLDYYASNTSRAVSLPEALDLAPEMVVPPQHGLDEPPALTPAPTPEVAEPAPATPPERTVFEAPLGETRPVHEPAGAGSLQTAPQAHDIAPVDREDRPEPPTPVRVAPVAPDRERVSESPPAAPPPAQNWWQRLLGLGNP